MDDTAELQWVPLSAEEESELADSPSSQLTPAESASRAGSMRLPKITERKITE
jgi:hypothetical protein